MDSILEDKELMKMHVDLQKRFPICHVYPKCMAALLCCKGNEPCTSYSRTFTIHNYGYGTAYNFTHNIIMLEHTAMNETNTTKHTDANIAQF